MGFKKYARRTFTMVEVMAAMAIIAILAALGVKGMQFANQAAAESATKANMEKVKIFLEDFKKLKGYYPQKSFNFSNSGNDFTDGDKLYLEFELVNTDSPNLIGSGSNYEDNAEFKKFFKDYTELLNSGFIEAVDTDSDNADDVIRFLDGYGTNFYYICPGIRNVKSYDLLSAGSDGFFDYEENKDDTNSNEKGNSYYSTSTKKGNVDNITNWQ